MPQTVEHLAMLDLYGIRRGIVVLNKIDKVDPEWRDLVMEELAGVLAGTFLATAPVIPASAVTGEGLAAIKDALLAASRAIAARDAAAPFRMWIDRAFSIKGHGVVVTGSVLSGTVRLNDSLLLYPAGRQVRVRGLETHGRKVDAVAAGQRAAINIAGIELEGLGRGMFLSQADRALTSKVWAVKITWRDEALPGTRIRLHLGTGEYIGRLGRSRHAPPGFYRVAFEAPVAGAAGDRAILRLYSPQRLLGAALFLRPAVFRHDDGKVLAALADALASADPAAIVGAVLEGQERPLEMADILRRAGYLPDVVLQRAAAELAAAGKAALLGPCYFAAGYLDRLTKTAVELAGEYHAAHRDRPGLAKDVLRQRLNLDERAFEPLLAHWQARGVLAVLGGDAALPEHAAQWEQWRASLAERMEAAFSDAGFADLTPAVLAARLGLSDADAAAAHEAMVRDGSLVRLGEIHVYRKTIQYTVRVIQEYFQREGTITVAQIRDLLATSRRIAVPLLEYLDLHKYTIRSGDIRRPGPKLRNFSE